MEPNVEPKVFAQFEKSTGTWQYVVADQETRRCVIINPTHNYDPDEAVVSTASPDALLDVVRRNDYKVDWLLETTPAGHNRTAVYYTRMQLLERQGFAPRTCGGSNVSFMSKNFARKYGGGRSKFTTTFEQEFHDGDVITVGNMCVMALEVDGPTNRHLGYVVGRHLFGFHYFTHLGGLERVLPDSDITALRLRHIWLSLAKILSFSPESRIYYDHTAWSDMEDAPYSTVYDNRRCNKFAEMSEQEFIRYWKARLNPACAVDADRPTSKRERFQKNSRLAVTS